MEFSIKKIMSSAIVTGGAKGIGKAIVQMLARNGVKVIINYKNSEEDAKKLKDELINENCTVEIFKADVSKKDEVEDLVSFAKQQYGDIDILINNAGISQIKLFTKIEEEEWDFMINNNLKSVYLTTKAVVDDMIKNKKRLYNKYFFSRWYNRRIM